MGFHGSQGKSKYAWVLGFLISFIIGFLVVFYFFNSKKSDHLDIDLLFDLMLKDLEVTEKQEFIAQLVALDEWELDYHFTEFVIITNPPIKNSVLFTINYYGSYVKELLLVLWDIYDCIDTEILGRELDFSHSETHWSWGDLMLFWLQITAVMVFTIWARGVGPRFRADQMSDFTWKDALILVGGWLFFICCCIMGVCAAGSDWHNKEFSRI